MAARVFISPAKGARSVRVYGVRAAASDVIRSERVYPAITFPPRPSHASWHKASRYEDSIGSERVYPAITSPAIKFPVRPVRRFLA